MVGLLLNLLACERVNGKLVAYFDNSCECYQGAHFAGAMVAILAIIVLFLGTLACRAFIFPIKVTVQDPVARLDYTSFPLFHVSRTIMLCVLLGFPEVPSLENVV